jgi:multidrug efflux pump subunit AcrB
MHEVTGPIVAIVLTLTAVFVPIGFLGGLTGELYRQFAVTIAIAVVISGLVALTLTPVAVRAGPEARCTAQARLSSPRSIASSRASPAITRGGSRG